MELSNIASHQVNFRAQAQVKTSPIEAVKNKVENMEDGEKITVGLTGLGILALGGLMIAKKLRQGKGDQAVEVAQELGKKGAEVVQNIASAPKTTRTINLVTEAPRMTSAKAFDLVDASSGKKAAESAAVFLKNDPQDMSLSP